jgi:CubicO group peptidase (beta-lactamase class C family)
MSHRLIFPSIIGAVLAIPPNVRSDDETREAEPSLCPNATLLDKLVPESMDKYHVPGVSLMGIENRRVAWHRQYGVRRAGSPEKVDRDTGFEACSMSKTALAYLALRLVEQGNLDLDRPLVEYLDEPYLTNQPHT